MVGDQVGRAGGVGAADAGPAGRMIIVGGVVGHDQL